MAGAEDDGIPEAAGALSLSHTLTLTLTQTHTHSLTLSLSHTHSLSHSHAHSLTHTLSLSLYHTQTHTQVSLVAEERKVAESPVVDGQKGGVVDSQTAMADAAMAAFAPAMSAAPADL